MRRNPRLFRLTASVALAALLWNAALPLAAVAQPAPPPLPQPYPFQPYQAQPDQSQADQSQADQSQADPPARVGRIAHIAGTVSFRNEGDTQWSPVGVNYPVSTGNAFWTEPSATAELGIADSHIVLAGTTEFDIATLDGSGLRAVAAQGEVYIDLRDPPPTEAWLVQTPRGLVRLIAEGRYDIVVGTTEQPTLVTVLDGAAEIQGPGVSLQVARGQTAAIVGTDSFEGSIGPALLDPFLTAQLDAERQQPAPTVQIPAQVAVMPGGSDLAGYGDWSEVADYGQVWYPPVSADWVPYREGHWAYVAPWGWTWIDDAPWGFAPFHYGRWIEIGGRWAWTPGGYPVAGPPVYAPALVTFIGISAGVVLGTALAYGSIGWVPLGPHEPFHPWYRASDRYVRAVNVSHTTNIDNNVAIDTVVNRRAATSIPGSAMAGSRPVQSVAQRVTTEQLATARPIVGQQPISPTTWTAGVTPSVAHRLNLVPTAGVRSAPGPAVRPPAAGPAELGFAHPSGLPTPPAGRPIQLQPAIAEQVPRAEPRPLPQVMAPSYAEPQHFAPPAAMPRAEPQHFAPQAAVRPSELQHSAPPAPRSEPPHPAAPAPTAHERRPGERWR